MDWEGFKSTQPFWIIEPVRWHDKKNYFEAMYDALQTYGQFGVRVRGVVLYTQQCKYHNVG